MKTYSNLFRETVSLESVLSAWDEFKIGKQQRPDVQVFERNLEDNLFRLQDELVKETYRHAPYTYFYIRDPKVRLIHKSSVRDRIVHHTVFRTLNTVFEPTFIFDSYSCRIDKGMHRAVARLRTFLHRVHSRFGTCFVLKCDIQKFFHSLDHEILMSIIVRRIHDKDLLRLVEHLISSFREDAAQRERERE